MTSTEHTSGLSPSGSLQRGRACVSCRRRKMRCDGERPTCGQCRRANRAEDCEYTDGQGRSRTQLLEENIARLEARIHELEHPEEPVQSVALYNPYGQGNIPPPILASPEVIYRPNSTASSPAAGSSTSSTSSHLQVSTVSPVPLVAAPSDNWQTQGEPHSPGVKLIEFFLPLASEFGFFLNVPNFRSTAFSSLPSDHHARPSSAIVSTMCLWGAHLSRSEFLLARESSYLARALHDTSQSLSSNHPRKILHTIQAEVLLANYFFRNGRFLEGKYHSSAAVALALSCGLNKAGSQHAIPAVSALEFFGRSGFELPPAQDSIEEGERIDAFWTVFALDKCWSVALCSPPSILDNGLYATQIETPWPYEMSDYEQGLIPQNLHGDSTLDTFLRGLGGSDRRTSKFTLYVQASFLLERASTFAARWKSNLPQGYADTLYAEFLSLDALINKFVVELPPIDESSSNATVRSLLVTYTVARAAHMQLHHALSQTDVNSNQQCLKTAAIVTGLLETFIHQEPLYMNPIIAKLWTAVCLAFIDEILKLRSFQVTWSPNVPALGENEYMASLEKAMESMATLTHSCPLMRFQYNRVQEAYSSLLLP